MSLYIPKGFSETPQEGYIKLFPELFVHKDAAKKIDVINSSLQHSMQEAETKTFTCNEISREIFTILYGLSVEKKTLQEISTQEIRQHPFIYEHLTGQLSFFYPCSFEKNSKLALKELFGMSLEDAEAMVSDKVDSLTIGLVLAEKKIRQSIYFENRIEAQSYFKKVNKYTQAYCKAKSSSDQNELKRVKKKIEILKGDFQKFKESPRGKQNAAQFVNDLNPLIRLEARKAAEILNDYRQTIQIALESCESDMSNTQALKHLIGPKNYLLSDYGIVYLKDANNPKQPFRYVPALQGTCIAEKRSHYAPNLPFSLQILTNQLPIEIENTIIKFISQCSVNDRRLIDKLPNSLNFHRNNWSLSPKKIHPEINVINDPQVELVLKLRNEKNQIYFSSDLEAKKWFEAHPHPKEFKQYKLTIWAQHHASHFLDSGNPKIYLAAVKATKIIANYRTKTIEGLKACGADLNQEKLLEHLIGPKNYLFSYYGITQNNDPTNRFPFCFTPGTKGTYETDRGRHISFEDEQFTYELNNKSPKALEEEISSDLTTIIKKSTKTYLLKEIPSPIIKEDEDCYLESSSLIDLKNELGPKISRWSTLEPHEKKAIYQKILEYNEWTQFNINPDHLELNFPEEAMEDNVSESISGKLSYPREIAISFNTINYLIQILEGSTNPNKSISLLYLKTFTAQNTAPLVIRNDDEPVPMRF